jgi:hypothetical protein
MRLCMRSVFSFILNFRMCVSVYFHHEYSHHLVFTFGIYTKFVPLSYMIIIVALFIFVLVLRMIKLMLSGNTNLKLSNC